MSHLPVSTVSTYAYVNPIVAVLAGVVILGEHLTWHEGLGAALVVGSVVIILRRASSASRPTQAPGARAPDAETLPAVAPPARSRPRVPAAP